jgi:hypothetical protein
MELGRDITDVELETHMPRRARSPTLADDMLAAYKLQLHEILTPTNYTYSATPPISPESLFKLKLGIGSCLQGWYRPDFIKFGTLLKWGEKVIL